MKLKKLKEAMKMEQFSVREIVHALRNPLTAILSNLELLTHGYISEIDDETAKVLNEITFNAKYMETLMRNASDIVKVKDRKELACREVDIKETLSQILVQMEAITSEVRNQIILDIEDSPVLPAEPDMIRRFFAVILFELFKFTNEKRRLNLKIFQQDSDLLINISFTEGFDRELLEEEKIFQELFISPTQRHNKLSYAYFNKIFTLFDGRAELLKEDDSTYLQILFKSSI